MALTPAGVETRARLQAMYYEPPEDLLTLDVATLEALRNDLAVLPRRSIWSPAPEARSAAV